MKEMSVVEFATLIVAGLSNLAALIGNFIGAPWVVLVNPIAEAVTIVLVSLLAYFHIQRNKWNVSKNT
jgi:hypothetical protein